MKRDGTLTARRTIAGLWTLGILGLLLVLAGCTPGGGYGLSFPNPSAGPFNSGPYDFGPRSPNPGGAYAG
jgi:hypothetical protein